MCVVCDIGTASVTFDCSESCVVCDIGTASVTFDGTASVTLDCNELCVLYVTLARLV